MSWIVASSLNSSLVCNGIPCFKTKASAALGRYYVMYINKTYQRTGTLWEGRYKSTLVDSDNYFLLVSRYIELNPVRANMVDHPAEYPWSSYHGNALDKDVVLLSPHHSYQSLGTNKRHVNGLINTCLNTTYLNSRCRK